jgi:hypothetical protein
MRKTQKGIVWVAEEMAPKSFVYMAPDNKGTLAKEICDAIAKKRRIFKYIGVQLPKDAVKEISRKHAGVHLINLDEFGPCNADMAFAEEHYEHVWHNPVVMVMSEQAPMNSAIVFKTEGEPPLWITPKQAVPQRSFKVQTRNCVADPEIQENIFNSLTLGLPSLPRCAAHGEKAVIVSAGPSLVSCVEDIRRDEGRLVCVKHSHDLLLDLGIVPWACVLLDPRAHVQDFVENPDPRVKYFVSSTCHPSTYDRLLSRGANVWMYHALVGAGEDQLIKMFYKAKMSERHRIEKRMARDKVQMNLREDFEIADMMVSGGTTAASRGISLMHMLGFRRFSLHAFDSCYFEPKDLKEKKDDGQPRYHKLAINGKEFYTDAELVAQVQDFQWIVNNMEDVTFEWHGDGMVPATMDAGWHQKPQLADIFPAT